MKFTTVPRGNKSLRLDSLRLANFRCFASLELSFHEDLTVLVADNGHGKTAILDAIATVLGPFVGGFDDGKDHTFDRDDIRLIRVGDTNRMELADGGVSVAASGLIDYNELPWSRRLAGPKSRTTRKDAALLTHFATELQRKVRQEADGHTTATLLPLVAYYPTDRLWNLRRIPYKPLPKTSRMVGYTHCLESGSDFHLMAEWFRYWSINALNRRAKAQQIGTPIMPGEFEHAVEVVRNAINRCLKPSGWGDMDFSVEREEIVARHPHYGEMPIAMLSDGIRSVLTLVADIAFRTIKLNPNLGPYAATDTDGIVLIDEVDLHLHPAWQQTVLGSLREAFPRIQFIVTTHSPQVLTSVPGDCIRILRQEIDADTGRPITVVQEPDMQTMGVESSAVLAHVMHTDPVPDVGPARSLSHYTALIERDEENSPEAQALRRELIAHFGAEHPLMLECDRKIRLRSYYATLKANKPRSAPEA